MAPRPEAEPLLSLNLLSARDFPQHHDSERLLGAWLASAPGLTPDRWGIEEPLVEPFTPDDLDGVLDACHGEVFLSRDRGPRGDLGFSPWTGRQGIHARVVADVHGLDPARQYPLRSSPIGLIDFVEAARDVLPIDLALIHVAPDNEAEIESHPERTYRWVQEPPPGWATRVYTRDLHYFLPTLYWYTLFGPPYVELLGLERLLSAPAFRVDQLADDAVALQLTPDPLDSWRDWGGFVEARSKAMAHLGEDVFWNPELERPFLAQMDSQEEIVKRLQLGSQYNAREGLEDRYRVPDFSAVKQAAATTPPPLPRTKSSRLGRD